MSLFCVPFQTSFCFSTHHILPLLFFNVIPCSFPYLTIFRLTVSCVYYSVWFPNSFRISFYSYFSVSSLAYIRSIQREALPDIFLCHSRSTASRLLASLVPHTLLFIIIFTASLALNKRLRSQVCIFTKRMVLYFWLAEGIFINGNITPYTIVEITKSPGIGNGKMSKHIRAF
jgi:hypothetical protein